jgi:hypothetical protein
MSQLDTAVQALIAASESSHKKDILQPLCLEVSKSALGASSSEVNAAVATLAATVAQYGLPKAVAAGHLALAAGCLIDGGASPAPLIAPLLKSLPRLLNLAGTFAAEAAKFALSPEESKKVQDQKGGAWVKDRFVPAEQMNALRERNPNGRVAARCMNLWCPPAISCLSRDMTARTHARMMIRIDPVLRDFDASALWLARLLDVRDYEPYLVIAPDFGIGFRLRVSGVADNFQLQTLLADVLIGNVASTSLPGDKPPELAAAVAWGTGPQKVGGSVTGHWDLYNWKAVSPGGTLSRPVPTANWILGEQIPSEIPMFADLRVILLAPPSYLRGWGNSRRFAGLRASMAIEEILDPQVVTAWMKRFGDAPR